MKQWGVIVLQNKSKTIAKMKHCVIPYLMNLDIVPIMDHKITQYYKINQWLIFISTSDVSFIDIVLSHIILLRFFHIVSCVLFLVYCFLHIVSQCWPIPIIIEKCWISIYHLDLFNWFVRIRINLLLFYQYDENESISTIVQRIVESSVFQSTHPWPQDGNTMEPTDVSISLIWYSDTLIWTIAVTWSIFWLIC